MSAIVTSISFSFFGNSVTKVIPFFNDLSDSELTVSGDERGDTILEYHWGNLR